MSPRAAISPEDFRTFGELLKYLRRRTGLTQRELSIAVGYSDAQISRLERNQRVPDRATLSARFVSALHIEHEPALVARLLDLADAAREGKPANPPSPGPSPAAPQSNLPVQVTRFVGRENEMAAVRRLLDEAHLVTLTGSGGCGKTRLALQVCANLVEAYPDGVWWVDLSSSGSPTLVPQKVAAALGVREEAGRALAATLRAHLQSQNLLLLLDDCEHLIEGVAPLAAELLAASPDLRVLVTSREALGIAGEVRYVVPPLSFPDPQSLPQLPSGAAPLDSLARYEAVQLFLDRASAALPGYALSADNAAAIAQVCARLDGVPLAIELAAAKVSFLSAGQILARLDDRFQLLTGGSRAGLPRHQTLLALIDWSHDLLAEPERRLLRRLSVFAGGWTLEAAEGVCGALPGEVDNYAAGQVLELLAQLVNKSLVVADRKPGQSARYRLLESIRQYARVQLREASEEEQARHVHLAYYLAWAEAAEAKLHGPDQSHWLRLLEADHDNLRAALEWSQAEAVDGEMGLRLAAALHWFWFIRNHVSEGRSWLAAALIRPGADGRTLARAGALYAAGSLDVKRTEFVGARRLLEACIALARELGEAGERVLGLALTELGALTVLDGDTLHARPLFEESSALHRRRGDGWELARALHWQGTVAVVPQNPSAGRRLLEESLAMSREMNDRWARSFPLGSLGNAAYWQGDHEAARGYYEEALEIQREFGDTMGVAWSLWYLAHDALDHGDYDLAVERYEECLSIYRRAEVGFGTATMLSNLAEVARRRGDFEQSAKLYEESLALRRRVGNVARIAYSLNGLGRLAISRGEFAAARRALGEAIGPWQSAEDDFGLAHAVQALGLLAAALQRWEGAATIIGAVQDYSEALCYSLLPIWRAEHDQTIASARAALGEAAFAAAWEAGRKMSVDGAVEYALEATRTSA